MKIDPDDPKLTAYALGELAGEERAVVERALAESPEARAIVGETQQLAGLLRRDYAHELQRPAGKPANIMPLPQERSFWSDARWPSITIAALLAVAFVVAAVVLGDRLPWSPRAAKEQTTIVQMEFPQSPSVADLVAASSTRRDAFVSVGDEPVSTFPLRVGNASYDEIRRALEAGQKPARETVRIEEMVNAFTYEYPAAEPGEAFTVVVQAASCPWEPKHRLVRIALKSEEAVRGADVQVQFNRARASSYRLLGYESRVSATSGADAEIAAGHAITALYEVVPAPNEGQPVASDGPVDALKPNTGLRPPASIDVVAAPSAELLTVKVRYQAAASPDRTAQIEKPLVDTGLDFHNASADLKFAAAVARLGMLLRDPTTQARNSLAELVRWAQDSAAGDASGERARFIQLAQRAEAVAF
jgi:anti-sigma factor RsiW